MAIGVPHSSAGVWVKSGYLTRVLPKVYAVGHTAPSRMAELWAAVLYAGPGAMLSHASAAHHRCLLRYPPTVIHVSTPRTKVKSIPDVIQVHTKRKLARCMHDGIPTTTVAQTALDVAAGEGFELTRTVLAQLDFRKQLDLEALERVCGRGRPGSTTLRAALAKHQPELARTNGELEKAFLLLCERFELPVPRFNTWIHGEQPDAYWPEHRLVVEVDGYSNHSSPAQLRNDRRKELTLRAHGLTVVRYDWYLVRHAATEVYEDLTRQLAIGEDQ